MGFKDMSDKDKDFSLKEAIKEARSDFSHAIKPFLFMDVNDQKKDGTPKRYGHFIAKFLHRFHDTSKDINRVFDVATKTKNSYAYRYRGFPKHFMVINNSMLHFDEKYTAQEKYFTFDHELAHMLTPFKFTDAPKESPVHECIADAYAVIRSIQRFGDDSAMVKNNIWFRAYEGIQQGGWDHFTTPVLERILKDSQHKDFSKLSPAQTLIHATAYGKVYAPSVADIETPHKHFLPLSSIMKRMDPTHLFQLENLSHTTLSSPDNFTFRIGVRAFQPFLVPEGVNFNDQHIQLSRPIRETYLLKLSNEAKKRGMDDLVVELKENQSCFLPQKAKKVGSNPAPAPFSIKF